MPARARGREPRLAVRRIASWLAAASSASDRTPRSASSEGASATSSSAVARASASGGARCRGECRGRAPARRASFRPVRTVARQAQRVDHRVEQRLGAVAPEQRVEERQVEARRCGIASIALPQRSRNCWATAEGGGAVASMVSVMP